MRLSELIKDLHREMRDVGDVQVKITYDGGAHEVSDVWSSEDESECHIVMVRNDSF